MDAGREARLLAAATAAVPGGGGCRLCSSSGLCYQEPELTILGPADPLGQSSRRGIVNWPGIAHLGYTVEGKRAMQRPHGL